MTGRVCLAVCAILAMVALASPVAHAARTVTTAWGGDGELVYDTGFMHMLMKNPDGGVSLFNMELIENDSPGAGQSEKGVCTFTVWGKNRARKILALDDPRAHSAWVVIFVKSKTGKYPLTFSVNGHKSEIPNWNTDTNIEWYRWSGFPAGWLKKGNNVIDLFCPEANSEEEGWTIYISRADEFADGGSDPAHVGETSFASFDGGGLWKRSPFGLDRSTRAELSVRLSLDRFIRNGWLASPVIDLWNGDSADFIVPLREIQSMKLVIEAEVTEGTAVEYLFRRGTDPDPFSGSWEPYRPIGSGPRLEYDIGGADLNRRYVQFKAVLSTRNPLKSPVIRSANVTAELLERVPLNDNVFVVEADNPVIRYSSVEWEWESAGRPEFRELRDRENLDEVIEGCRTQFDAQVKLLDYVTKRWRHSNPVPEFPGWDALSILNRTETAGAGGYCLTFNNLLGGMCMAYGWQARIVNCVIHEVVEVWNDDFGKWIFLDADYTNHYNYDTKTGVPLDLLDLHERYLDYFFPAKTLDWMTDKFDWKRLRDGEPPPVGRGSQAVPPNVQLTGFINAAFMRMVPRNNWYEKPFPRPLNHGLGTDWPWNGYVNWYDSQTPPHRNFFWHTDRQQDMWPVLNRVHVDAVQGMGNDRVFLRFETYTPNFSHFEVNVDDTGWKRVGDRWTWLFQSGRNTLRVRAVNKLGAKGKPSVIIINHADRPFADNIE